MTTANEIKIKYNTPLDIATANSRKAAKWRNESIDWQTLLNKLSITRRTGETFQEYMGMSKDKQDNIKDVGGFVGGYLKNGKRMKENLKYRSVVCLDVDFGNLEVWSYFEMLEFAGLMYTTHKHTPDKPRFRIVFPLNRKVNAEEYEAIARVVASQLDIEAFDDTTFQPIRLMYYPSTSKYGEFIFKYVDKPIADTDKILAELRNSKDPTTWPASKRSKEVIKTAKAAKAQDPQQKGGLIGTFCRAYNIHSVISEFLSEVYMPCEGLGKNRYTFTGGTTHGGLIVYDDVFAYSHHSTDPACGVLCNAFDLVRLHKFSYLDAREKENEDKIERLPSFKAALKFIEGLQEVNKELIREKYEAMGGNLQEVNTAWLEKLEVEGRKIKNSANNVTLILKNDDKLKNCFGFNEFEQRETVMKPLPWDMNIKKYPRPLSDADDAGLRLYIDKCYSIRDRNLIADALVETTRYNTYNPVRDYLNGVKWDDKKRLETLFIDIFGAANTPYIRTVTRKAFCAAVARIYEPGCKYDHVLVIIGEQGVGKSTALKRLGGDWFSDSMHVLTGKEALEQVQGAWLIEMGELAGLKKADVDAVKQFVSKSEDRFRVSYGKRVEHFPRSCVFFGTTNEEGFLRDTTGNRRFWVVDCRGARGKLKFSEYLSPENVSLIWAEAKEYYKKGEPLYLEEDLESEAKNIQDKHLEKDERGGMIEEYLERLLPEGWEKMGVYERRAWLKDQDNIGRLMRERACILEIWTECLCKDPSDITRMDSFALARIIKSSGDWISSDRSVRFKLYGKQKIFERRIKGNF